MNLSHPPFSYIPLLPALCGVVAGVLLGWHVAMPVWLVGGALLLAVMALLLRWQVAVEILLSMALGISASSVSVPRVFDSVPGKDVEMTGVVKRVALLAEMQRIEAEVTGATGRSFVVQITYPAFEPVVSDGDIIRFSGTYSLPRRNTDLPLENDMETYYRNRGISMLCYVPSGSIEVTGRSGNPLYMFRRWRREVVDMLLSSPLDERAAIFVAAVLTGDSDAVDIHDRRGYAVAGVAHILALSGAHVAVMAMIVSLTLFPLAIIGRRRARWWITIAVLWAYALFTGMSPSVCRAVIMTTVVLLSLIFDRPRSSLNALCLAAILILLFSPSSLFGAGFQLSFVATLAIILLSPRLQPHGVIGHPSGRIWGVIAATLAATIGTMPLVAYHFHTVPVYFLLANMVAVLVMPVMIGGGVLLTLLLLAGVEPSWLIRIIDAVYSIFDAIVSTVASLPHASVGGIYVSAWLLIPSYLSIAFLAAWLFLRQRCYIALTAATALFTVGVYFATKPVYADGEAYIVRSHAATVIACHRGDTLSMLTTASAHNFQSDSIAWTERYRDYIATRGITTISVQSLDSVLVASNGIIPFGHHTMTAAHALTSEATAAHATYCIVPACWYGDPVALFHSANADTLLLSTEINSRRRRRYRSELEQAGIPVIDLADRPLSSR